MVPHILSCAVPVSRTTGASDECPVLNEIAEKLARYERLEEQAAELVTGFLEKGIQMTQKALEKVAGGAVDLVFKEVERGEKDE